MKKAKPIRKLLADAPISRRIMKLLVTPGQHVEAKDLLVAIAP